MLRATQLLATANYVHQTIQDDAPTIQRAATVVAENALLSSSEVSGKLSLKGSTQSCKESRKGNRDEGYDAR